MHSGMHTRLQPQQEMVGGALVANCSVELLMGEVGTCEGCIMNQGSD